MGSCDAWLISVGATEGASQVVAGHRELIHLEQAPRLTVLPGAPAHARHLLSWQGRLLPAVDLGIWRNVSAQTDQYPVAGIVAYQNERGGEPQFGALLLYHSPRLTTVQLDQPDTPSLELAHWAPLLASYIAHHSRALPILDFARLFTAPPSQTARRPQPTRTPPAATETAEDLGPVLPELETAQLEDALLN